MWHMSITEVCTAIQVTLKWKQTKTREEERKKSNQPASIYTTESRKNNRPSFVSNSRDSVDIPTLMLLPLLGKISEIFSHFGEAQAKTTFTIVNAYAISNALIHTSILDSSFCSFRFILFFFLQRNRKEYFVSLIRLNKSVVKGKPIRFHIILAISQPFDAH